MPESGYPLLQHVANRILGAHLGLTGCGEVVETTARPSYGRNVDLACLDPDAPLRIKVKPDPYFGTDPAIAADRNCGFYRADADAYAIEARDSSHGAGWALDTDASQIWYYRLAVETPEEEVRALVRESDAVLFSELAVGRDELVTVPVRAFQAWFESEFENYPSRPVAIGDASAWHRIVPREDLERSVDGIRIVGPVFAAVRAVAR